jgi:2-polyprenyl-3-methyl-5-hydroxy-6-metoxy-1,4-benzoquinol methylase
MPEPTCCICGGSILEFAYPGSTASPTNEQVAPSRHHSGEQPELHRCARCRVLQAKVVEEDLRAAYTGYDDEAYVEEEQPRRVTARRLLDRAGPADTPLRVLDVGCGPGLLLDEARARGWDAFGVELSSWAVRRCRANGLDVYQGTLEEAAFPGGHFDAVFMIDVIEHLTDPIATLVEVTRVLRPGGKLCMVTPDAASAAARLLGTRWWAQLPGHIVLFPRPALTELIRMLGYQVPDPKPEAKHFSVDYLLGLASGYLPPVKPLRSALGRTPLGRWVVPLNLLDESVLVATRPDPAAAPEPGPDGLVMPAATSAGTYHLARTPLPRGHAAWTFLSRETTAAEAARAAVRIGAGLPGGGYGATQKALLLQALEHSAAAVVVVKADNDYDAGLVAELAEPVLRGEADLVLGSRDLADPVLRGRMPAWKRLGNRGLSFIERRALGIGAHEFHSGYRAMSPAFLEKVPFLRGADGLVFDQETVSQAVALGLRVVQVPLATRYFADASPTGPAESVRYGLGTLAVLGRHLARRSRLVGWRLHDPAWHVPVTTRVAGLRSAARPDAAASSAPPVQSERQRRAAGGSGAG